jgi:hypothetical protein
MSSQLQCGLCLSCGAPFAFKSQEISFFTRVGNLSVLFLNEECRRNPTLNSKYENPKFASKMQESHIIHRAHHQAAVRYMTKHHSGDDAPKWPVGGGPIPDQNGPMPYFKAETGKTGPEVAVWKRPTDAQRVKLPKLVKFFADFATARARTMDQNLDETFKICEGCNGIMTNLSMSRYLLGCNTVSENNPAPIIEQGSRPVSLRKANAQGVDLPNAFGLWTYDGLGGITRSPTQMSQDPLSPFVAYYLHLCLPYQASAADLPWMTAAVRLAYVEITWLLFMVACTVTVIEGGKFHGVKPSSGPQQHYGVLDVYVSHVVWRLAVYEFGRTIVPDFVQWHQKYFWEAIRLRGFRTSGVTTVGLFACPDARMPSKDLIAGICEGIMTLYHEQLRPLILVVVGQPAGNVDPEEYAFAKRFFIPRRSLKALTRQWDTVSECVFACVLLCDPCPMHRAWKTTSRTRSSTSGSTRCCRAPSS